MATAEEGGPTLLHWTSGALAREQRTMGGVPLPNGSAPAMTP